MLITEFIANFNTVENQEKFIVNFHYFPENYQVYETPTKQAYILEQEYILDILL